MLNYLFTQTPLRFFCEGLWRDEAFSLFLAEKSLGEIITLTVLDFNPPLYYFLLHFWIGLFGTSELAMRSLSALFYIVGVFAVYEIFRLVLKKTHLQTAFYTALFAFNPILIYYAFEARMYTMLLCFSLVSTYFLLKKQPMAYLLVLIAGLYTHYFMILVLISQFIFIVLMEIKDKKSFHKNKIIVYQFVAGLLFLPWAVYFLSQNANINGEFWITGFRKGEVSMVPGYLFSGLDKDFYAPVRWDKGLQSLLKNFALFTWVTFAIGGFFAWRKKVLPKTHVLFFLSYIIPTFLVVATIDYKPLFLPRYLIAASAMLSLSVLVSISSMPRLVKVGFFIVFIFFIYQFNVLQLEYRNRGGMRELAKDVLPMMKMNDVIYVTNELDLLDAMYYFGKDRVFIYGKTYDQIPVYVGKVIIPPSVVKSTLPRFPSKAFVIENSKNKIYKIESDFDSL